MKEHPDEAGDIVAAVQPQPEVARAPCTKRRKMAVLGAARFTSRPEA
jgi:hypothetical protein